MTGMTSNGREVEGKDREGKGKDGKGMEGNGKGEYDGRKLHTIRNTSIVAFATVS
jgi:hypothetical protein